LHGVVGGGDVLEAEQVGEEVAAPDEERGPLHSNGEMCVDIQIVAHENVALGEELVEDGVVAVGVVAGVVEEVDTHLETKTFLEDAGRVEGAELAGEQRHRDGLARGVLQGKLRIEGEVLRAHGRGNLKLYHLRGLWQLLWLEIAVEVDVPPEVVEVEAHEVVENRPVGTGFEHVLLPPIQIPTVVVAEIVGEEVVGCVAVERRFQTEIMPLLRVDGEPEPRPRHRVVAGVAEQAV